MIVKSLIAKLQNKYHVSVAEVDEHGWAAQIIQHEIDHLSGIIISGAGTDGGRGKNNL